MFHLLYSLLGFALFAGLEAKSSFVIYSKGGSAANSTFSIRTEEDQPQLHATWKYLSNTTADRICANDGTWFYYYVEDYASGGTFDMSYGCNDAITGIHLGSVRFVGERGVQRLNLYNGTICTYNATTFTTNQSVISTRFSSLALVGNVPVQLYLQPNYGGISYCVQADTPYSLVINTAEIGLQPGDVKSIRFGCTADAMVIQKQESNTNDRDHAMGENIE